MGELARIANRVAKDASPDWPEPDLIGAPAERRQPFPLKAMGSQATVISDIQRATKCPLALSAACVMATMSFAAQGRFDVRFQGQRTKPLSLSILSIAKSGERKSSADELAQIGVDKRIKELKREYLQAKSDADSGQHDGSPILDPNLVTSTGTVQGIAKGFEEGHPSQAIFNDEGGGFVQGHSMKRENKVATLTALSQFWAGRIPPHRTKGQGIATELISLDGIRLTMHLLAQRVTVKNFLSDPNAKGQGILARMLVHEPPSTMGTRFLTVDEWLTDSATPAVTQFADAVVNHLRRSVPRSSTGEVTRPVIESGQEASQLLTDYYNTIERSLAPNKALEEFSDITNKIHENAARIAGVLATFREERTIGQTTMEDGIELSNYFLSEMVRLSTNAAFDQTSEDALVIAKKLAANAQPTKRRDLSRSLTPRLKNKSDHQAAVAILEDANWVRIKENVFHLNPKLNCNDLLKPQ
ncbi:MAG: DUF3987 domain-containing protein [Pseudomonadota bacterium]